MINNDFKLPAYAGNCFIKKVCVFFLVLVLLSGCASLFVVSRQEKEDDEKNIPSNFSNVNYINEYREEMDWWKNDKYKGMFAYSGVIPSKRQITIAIIDTGITQDMLNNNKIYKNEREIANNNIDDDSNGFVDDINGWNFIDNNNAVDNYNINSMHASAMIGLLIGEDKENTYYGLLHNYNVRIVPIKSINDDTLSGSLESVIEGIRYAETVNADIAILSLSTYNESKKCIKL